jgi:hypothetical protein
MGAATAEASNGVGTAGCGEVRDAGAAELDEGVDVGVDGDSVAGEHPAISATAPKTAAVAWMDRMPPILWFGFVLRFGIGHELGIRDFGILVLKRRVRIAVLLGAEHQEEHHPAIAAMKIQLISR